MCIRSARSIISGKQHPLLSRVLNNGRVDRDPDRPFGSTCARPAPRGQLQIQRSTRICWSDWLLKLTSLLASLHPQATSHNKRHRRTDDGFISDISLSLDNSPAASALQQLATVPGKWAALEVHLCHTKKQKKPEEWRGPSVEHQMDREGSVFDLRAQKRGEGAHKSQCLNERVDFSNRS